MRGFPRRADAGKRAVWAGILHVVLHTWPGLPRRKLAPSLDFFSSAPNTEHLRTPFELVEWPRGLPKFRSGTTMQETTLVDWAKLAGTRIQRSCPMLDCFEERFQRTVVAELPRVPRAEPQNDIITRIIVCHSPNNAKAVFWFGLVL